MRAQGFDVARVAAVAFLETFRQEVAPGDREALLMVARTSLRTKLAEALADQLTDIVADAVLTIQKPDEPIDLYMVRCLAFTLSFFSLIATASRLLMADQHQVLRSRKSGYSSRRAWLPLLQRVGRWGAEGGAIHHTHECSC